MDIHSERVQNSSAFRSASSSAIKVMKEKVSEKAREENASGFPQGGASILYLI
jgi:hypothetical protein